MLLLPADEEENLPRFQLFNPCPPTYFRFISQGLFTNYSGLLLFFALLSRRTRHFPLHNASNAGNQYRNGA